MASIIFLIENKAIHIFTYNNIYVYLYVKYLIENLQLQNCS